MTILKFTVADLVRKAATARRDVPDLGSLRKLPGSKEGEWFFVEKGFFAWAPEDRMPDDGVSSIRPDAVPDSKPGRYRRVGLTRPTPAARR